MISTSIILSSATFNEKLINLLFPDGNLHPKCVKLLVAQFQASLCAKFSEYHHKLPQSKMLQRVKRVVFNLFLHLSDYII